MRPFKRPPREFTDLQKEILAYLAESGASRYRNPKFPDIQYVEDYGTGFIPDFNNPNAVGSALRNYLEPYQEQPAIEDILAFLATQDGKGNLTTGGTRGETTGDGGFEVLVAKALEDSDSPIADLVKYEESIHGAQERKPFDITLGRGVGRAKRRLRKAVKQAFTPEMMENIYIAPDDMGRPSGAGFKNYILSGPNSKMETEAKAISLKAVLRKYGVLDSPQMVDSDLDKVTKFYQDNPEAQDAFSNLFNPTVMKNEEYRKSLLDFMNRF